MLGAWRDDSTLVVTLLDASGARTVLGDSQVSLRQDGEDLDGDGVSGDVSHVGGVELAGYDEILASVHRVVRLSGDFGTAHASSAGADGHVPGIVQFSYRSESWGKKLTPSWSAGDTLRVRFDRPVNVRPDWPLQGERAS